MMTAAPEAEDPVEKVTKPDVFTKEGILLNQKAATKEEAIRQAGQLLVDRGCVDPSYIDAMLEREKIVTTYMGMGLAIPHGTTQAKGMTVSAGKVGNVADIKKIIFACDAGMGSSAMPQAALLITGT